MSMIYPDAWIIKSLRGQIPRENERLYVGVDKAIEIVVELSGVDFGGDVEKCVAWVESDRRRFLELFMRRKDRDS